MRNIRGGELTTRMTGRTLKAGLLLFWFLWFGIVFVTNVFDAFRALGVFGEGWTFASGNYDFLVATTAVHSVPTWVNVGLFAGVIAWQGLAGGLFWAAFVGYRQRGTEALGMLHPAFVASIALWGAFLLADEVFLAYDVASAHRLIFISLLATLIVLHVVPEGGEEQRAGIEG